MIHHDSPTQGLRRLALLLGAALCFPVLPAWAEDETPPEVPAVEEPAVEEKEAPEEAHPEPVIPWVMDYEMAKAQAASEKKDLFLFFTGSDWCGWCERLEAEVFADKAFADRVSQTFVLVFLDFPRADDLKQKIVNPEANQALYEEHHVGGFPTVVLTTASGVRYAQTGYREGGPEAYGEHLESLQKDGQGLKSLLAQKDGPTLEALKAGVPVLYKNDLLGEDAYAWVTEKVQAVDPDGSQGLQPYVSRVAEKKAIIDAATTQPGEEVDVEMVYQELKKATALVEDEDAFFASVSLHVAAWLGENGRFDEATAVVDRALGSRAAKDEERVRDILQKNKDALLQAKAEQAKEAAESEGSGDEPEDGADVAPEPGDEGAGEDAPEEGAPE